jgi:hypothetical protein
MLGKVKRYWRHKNVTWRRDLEFVFDITKHLDELNLKFLIGKNLLRILYGSMEDFCIKLPLDTAL